MGGWCYCVAVRSGGPQFRGNLRQLANGAWQALLVVLWQGCFGRPGQRERARVILRSAGAALACRWIKRLWSWRSGAMAAAARRRDVRKQATGPVDLAEDRQALLSGCLGGGAQERVP